MTFGYDEEPVLRQIDLEIPPSTITAVCGATGSGKSALLALLTRAYDPSAGVVEVGGVDLRSASESSLHEAVAIGTQRSILFSATLRENLALGHATATDAEMLDACRVALVDRFLPDLSDGLDTPIGERGVNLSGGQRQRVALARALLSPARLLILDDPLSAVDSETEREIVQRLRDAIGSRTIVLSSQRLSTVVMASRVVVLADGRVAEAGDPARLLGQAGPFSDLFADEVIGVS